MRKVSAAVVVLLLMAQAVLAGDAPRPTIGWFKRMFSRLTWSEVAAVADSPKEICSRVRHAVRYQEDSGDTWSSGKETWDRGYGDCEDIAAVVVELAASHGLKAEIRVLHPEDSWEAHAVVLGEHGGQMWLASNAWYYEVESLEEATAIVAREQKWGKTTVLVKTPGEAADAVTAARTGSGIIVQAAR